MLRAPRRSSLHFVHRHQGSVVGPSPMYSRVVCQLPGHGARTAVATIACTWVQRSVRPNSLSWALMGESEGVARPRKTGAIYSTRISRVHSICGVKSSLTLTRPQSVNPQSHVDRCTVSLNPRNPHRQTGLTQPTLSLQNPAPDRPSILFHINLRDVIICGVISHVGLGCGHSPSDSPFIAPPPP